MPYPENIVVRLIICIVGLFAIWVGIHFVMDSLVYHQTFSISTTDIVIPAALGVVQAFTWKPKKK